ncbi:MAG TPA: PA2169 family four-helix-bundle protein [Vicinamibacterales bacterium]|nr:PA2169 family four-helix-bundle protein [Vicinamibacterales bacterium]
MDNSTAISTLNNLIEICHDGENGFRLAAGAVKDAHAKALFERFSRQRAEMARELESEVRKLGGTPSTGGSVSGAVHRGWINIKSLVTGGDESAVIAEAERGEDAAKEAFTNALKDPLPAGARELIEQQAAIVKVAHDEVRTLEKTHAH